MDQFTTKKEVYVDVSKPPVDHNAQKVNVDKWSDMSINELLDQKSLMLNRYDFLAQAGKDTKMILQGIMKLEAMINKHGN